MAAVTVAQLLLDASGDSDEVLRSMDERELKVIKNLPASTTSPMPENLRAASVHLLCRINSSDPRFSADWFQQALMFDYVQLAEGYSAERLTERILAIAHFTMKANSEYCRTMQEEVAARSFVVQNALAEVGLQMSMVNIEAVNAEERRLIQRLIRLSLMPSAFSWMSSLLRRLSVFTNCRYDTSLGHIWNHSMSLAQMLAMRRSATHNPRPRLLATGLLGLSLVSATLLPWEALRPCDMCPEAWDLLYRQAQASGRVPSPALGPDAIEEVLRNLIDATDMAMDEIRKSCLLVAEALRDMLKRVNAGQSAAEIITI